MLRERATLRPCACTMLRERATLEGHLGQSSPAGALCAHVRAGAGAHMRDASTRPRARGVRVRKKTRVGTS